MFFLTILAGMDFNNGPDHFSFYLTCLQEISRMYEQPLTLLHHEKIKQLKVLQQSDNLEQQWNCFKENVNSSNCMQESLIMDILRILLWLSHYTIQSVGEKVAARKLSFDISSYLEVKEFFENQPPFKDLRPQTIISDENLNDSLNLLRVESFRSLQKEAITSTLSGTDTLCLFPTGYGKSLIYQLPAAFEYGVSLLFSPLCSLLSDQLDILGNLGIKSVWISANLSPEELDCILVSLNT